MKAWKRRPTVIAVAVVVGLLVTVTAIALVPKIRWRTQVIAQKATGGLEGITWPELLGMLRPGSGFWLKPIAEGRGLYLTIRNPYASQDDVTNGQRLFRAKCASCHGEGGAPNFAKGPFKHGVTDWALFNVISKGVPQTAMTGVSLEDREIWQIIAYVHTLQEGIERSWVAAVPEFQLAEVTYDRLRRSADEPGNWLTYSGSYDGQRYSSLEQIDRSTVNKLGVDWILQLQTDAQYSETTPLVVGDMMFLTVSPDKELAVSATTGQLIWSKQRSLPSILTNCCGPHNRGVAILGNTIFRGTLDGYLIARDAMTGDLKWEVEVGSASAGFSITAAPLVVEDLVITGVSGGDYGIRGYLDAYDAKTGQLRWRLNTVPGTGEPGNDTWAGDSWERGGGGTWMTGGYDPNLRLVYWGVGNPAPVFNGDNRKGDNLYTNSMIAVDVDSGEMRWYFQFTPHDLHDWDANQVPVLVDTEFDGQLRRLLLTANKNGFGYVLDRVTGEFLLAHELVEQTWAASIDPQGRPLRNEGVVPTIRGALVRPGVGGGANWWPPSYNPLTKLVHYSVRESENIFFKSAIEFREREPFLASGPQTAEFHQTAIKAYRAGTGQLVWEFRLPPRKDWPRIGGSLTTAGQLVFFGEKEYFFALDAETGEELWRANLGASIHAAPITFLNGGRQRIAIAAGRSLYSLSIH